MTTAVTSTGIAHDLLGESGSAPVVLLHAGIADRRMWDPQWDALARRHRVLRLDLRGFGDSDTLPTGGTPVDHVADVLAALDELGIGRCHLVGASFGAGVAVEVALVRPAVVESLLLCPPGGSLLEEAPQIRAFVEAEDAALERDDLGAAVEANLDWWVVGAGRTRADVPSSVLEAVAVMQRRAFEIGSGWGDIDEVELEPPALDRLGELRARTLVLSGSHDLDSIQQAVARVRAEVPDVRAHVWESAAHLPSMEHPDAFLELLLGWVAGTP